MEGLVREGEMGSKWPIMLSGYGHGNGQDSKHQPPRGVDLSQEKTRAKKIL